MSIACLSVACYMALAGGQPAASEPPHGSALRFVDVTIEAMPTDRRGLQIVTIQLRIRPNHIISAYHPGTDSPSSGMKVAINTRNPKTQVNIIYPKGREIKIGDTFSCFLHEGDVAIQAIVQRAEGDNSPIEGRLDYRVGTPFT